MSEEWQDLPTMADVARAEKDGWEIERVSIAGGNSPIVWIVWDGTSWLKHWIYRGRPKQPKTVTVTSYCWRNEGGALVWNGSPSPSYGWKRFPAGDIPGEVDA